MEENGVPKNLVRKSEYARLIGTAAAHVSNMTAQPKIIVTIYKNIEYIDIDKYPVEKFKKKGT